MKLQYVLFVVFAPVLAFAQAASPSPASIPALDNIANAIPGGLPTIAVSGFLLVSEFVARKWPTVNPLSWARVGKAGAHGLVVIFTKIEALLDQLIGQNLK